MFTSRHARHARPARHPRPARSASPAQPAGSAHPAGSARPAGPARPGRHVRRVNKVSRMRLGARVVALLAVGTTVFGLSACSPGAPLPNPGVTASQQAVAAKAQEASSTAPTLSPSQGSNTLTAVSGTPKR
jgi:hypothetical protein